ncbi:carbohydrate binding domain-containing protein [Patulibacter minatonensis]|uniref:carbohydrate binding domain-containing protein n=1 Tax=Patulibacter minatonensis TaxID=298163 RepID=UPI00047E6CDC|nr:carbohydrate binding domain-containing protein [Patulibacter minatonensis]
MLGALVGVGASPSPATAADTNLVGNPSFESGYSGWISYQGTPGNVQQSGAPDGNWVGTAKASTTGAAYTLDNYPTATASGGRTYTATAWVKAGTASSGKPIKLIVRSSPSSGNATECGASTPQNLTTTWSSITVTCVAPRSGDALDVYLVREDGVTMNETFFADKVSLVGPDQATVPSGNITANPSFEADVAGWDRYRSTVSQTPVADDPDAASGSRSATVKANAGVTDSYSIVQAPTSLNKKAAGAYTYTATAWVKGTPSSAGKTVTLFVREKDAADGDVQSRSAPVTLSADRFKKVTVSATAQATGDSIDVYAARLDDVSSGESFRIDAFTLTASQPGEVPAGNLTANPSVEPDATNWSSYQGTTPTSVLATAAPASAGVADAPLGTRVGKATASTQGGYDGYTFDDANAAVQDSVAGTTYTAGAWAKAAAAGGVAKNTYLVVRETNAAGATVGYADSRVVPLRADRYSRLESSYVAKDDHNKIDVYLDRRGDVVPGESFYADDITLTATRLANVFGSSVTVRPDVDQPSGGTLAATVSAAKNESASFQIALRTTGAGATVTGQSLLGGQLTGPSNATIAESAVTVAREANYTVEQPSDGEGAVGKWPDELIPDKDPLLGGVGRTLGSNQRAFPIVLGEREASTLWVDVNVPTSAAKGTYTGTIRLTLSGGSRIDVPVTVKVRDFTLPSTSSLRSIFTLNPFEVCRAPETAGNDGGYADIRPSYGGCDPSNEKTWQVFARFAQLGLRNRISISNPYATRNQEAPTTDPVTRAALPGAPTPPPGTYTQEDAFDTYVKPLLDGTAPQGTLTGAKLTTFSTWWGCIRIEKAGCLSRWKSVIDRHVPSAASRFLPWVCDEPFFDDAKHKTPWRYSATSPSGDTPDLGAPANGETPYEYPPFSCAWSRKTATDGWPGVPVKITTDLDDPGLYDRYVADRNNPPAVPTAAPTTSKVNVLANLVTDLVPRNPKDPNQKYSVRKAKFDRFAAQSGAELWGYTACSSAGCDPGVPASDPTTTDPEHDGWPSYSIDQPGSQASAMGWMSFMYGLKGESYFDTAYGFSEGPEFHRGFADYGANGDGLLFYPGLSDVTKNGATTTVDMPFESIRLKRIREGREDYEYLARLATPACGKRTQAMAIAQGLFGDLDHAMFSTTVTQAQLDAARDSLEALITSTTQCKNP